MAQKVGTKKRRWPLSGRTARAKAKGAVETRQLSYAVVGLGHIAQAAVLPAFAHAQENSRLGALVTGDPEKQARLTRKYKVKVYRYDALERCVAETGVEAVYLALPNHLHAEFTERCARLGLHVLCEKPMAVSTEECHRMIAACDSAGVRLMIAYRLHFEEANLKAMEAVRSGVIGEPRIFNSTFSFQVARDNIRTQRELGGGVLWDIGVYCLNAARYLFRAEPVEVYAQTATGRDARFVDTEEGASVLLRFPGDRLASFAVSFGAAATARYQLLGTEGQLSLENAYEYRGALTLSVTDKKGKTRTHRVEPRDQFAPELIYFSRCVLEHRRPEPDGLEGLADVRVIEAAYESARTGRPIRLEPVAKHRRPGADQQIARPAIPAPALVNVEAPGAD
ncbi:MAG: Gfo/Idh/MocA family oxidoreductase [Myxococcota bacterium]|nr:Gfo/Idh/MocA family oxidoreductase [Myxococcota bacterium]